MPYVSLVDSPPSSPKSPPRKRTKFSLKLKGKKKIDESEKKEKLYPIFSPTTCQDPTVDNAQDPPKPPPPYAGLNNHGNICYANAVLQVLRYCPGFAECVDEIATMVIKLPPNSRICREVETTRDVYPELNDTDSRDDDENQAVVCRLNELLCQMKDMEKDYTENKENCGHLLQKRDCLLLAAKPLEFMEIFRNHNPMFEYNLQHDAQEFLCSLLVNIQDAENDIQRKLKDTEKGYYSKNCSTVENHQIVDRSTGNLLSDDKETFSSHFEELFQGQLLHQTKCMTCEDVKKRFESFQDISVPVQKEARTQDPKIAFAFSPTPKKKGYNKNSLCWALSQFATVEHLTGDNKYFCDKCLTHTEAEITTCFDKLPKIFTIHLKRFTANSLSGCSAFVSKITSNLETPVELSIKEWCSKTCPHANPTYRLFGIVMHSGMTSCSGHYQAYVKVPVCSIMDINNNNNGSETLSLNSHHNTRFFSGNQTSDNSNTFRKYMDVESSEEVNSQNCLNTHTEKLFTQNTFSSGDVLVESNQQSPLGVGRQSVSQTPESSAEKAKTTCISGISRYFHRSRKDSTKEGKAQCEENGMTHGQSSGSGTQNTQNQQIPNCMDTDQSLRKIQSFKYHGSKYNNSAIRQLKFQDGEPVSISSKPKNFPDRTNHCAGSGKESSPSATLTTQTFPWIHFDDAEVQVLEESDLRTLLSSSESAFTSPYLLFYKLVEL